jgi:hypothetical protein
LTIIIANWSDGSSQSSRIQDEPPNWGSSKDVVNVGGDVGKHKHRRTIQRTGRVPTVRQHPERFANIIEECDSTQINSYALGKVIEEFTDVICCDMETRLSFAPRKSSKTLKSPY